MFLGVAIGMIMMMCLMAEFRGRKSSCDLLVECAMGDITWGDLHRKDLSLGVKFLFYSIWSNLERMEEMALYHLVLEVLERLDRAGLSHASSTNIYQLQQFTMDDTIRIESFALLLQLSNTIRETFVLKNCLDAFFHLFG